MVLEVVGRRSGGRKGRNGGVFGSSRSYERQLTGELTFEIRCSLCACADTKDQTYLIIADFTGQPSDRASYHEGELPVHPEIRSHHDTNHSEEGHTI